MAVNDDDLDREAIRAVLEDDGRVVESLGSCEAFLKAFDPGKSACLLVDAYLPGMSGLELLEKLRHDGHSLPAIMIASNADVPMAVQAMRAGALDFIEKPIGREELITGIERALMESCLAMGDLALIRRRPARATRPLGDSFQPNRNARSRYERRSREIRRAKPNHSASRYSIAAIVP